MSAAQRTPDYRRRVDVTTCPGRVVAEMEDYVHHFRVVLEHDGAVVTRAEGTGVRVPWTTCPLGAAGVAALTGTPIGAPRRPDEWVTDRTDQCTHVLDLAAVALGHAGGEGVRYDARVSPGAGPRRTAVLRDGDEELLRWDLEDNVVASGPFAGTSLRGPELKAAMDALPDPLLREQVAVLRRACQIAPSRAIDLDDYQVAAEISILDSSCHTLQPDVAARARRVRGTARPTERQA